MHATLVHTHTCWQCAFTSCIISFFEFCQYTNKKKIVTNSLSNKSNNNGRQQQRSSMLHAMAKEFTVRNDRDADDIAWMDIEENVEKEEQPREERERERDLGGWRSNWYTHTDDTQSTHNDWEKKQVHCEYTTHMIPSKFLHFLLLLLFVVRLLLSYLSNQCIHPKNSTYTRRMNALTCTLHSHDVRSLSLYIYVCLLRSFLSSEKQPKIFRWNSVERNNGYGSL